MHLIDTNIFLEVMPSRSRSEECKRLLGALRSGKPRGRDGLHNPLDYGHS
ncbi:hypothetical protein [Infirmifilum sp. NZ]|nr:hypothetical protein [Infirmifilum sp. NZ]UNQ73751.1 hypothetical protein MOV14_01750 [Infirmifilum sp. NZ]